MAMRISPSPALQLSFAALLVGGLLARGHECATTSSTWDGAWLSCASLPDEEAYLPPARRGFLPCRDIASVMTSTCASDQNEPAIARWCQATEALHQAKCADEKEEPLLGDSFLRNLQYSAGDMIASQSACGKDEDDYKPIDKPTCTHPQQLCGPVLGDSVSWGMRRRRRTAPSRKLCRDNRSGIYERRQAFARKSSFDAEDIKDKKDKKISVSRTYSPPGYGCSHGIICKTHQEYTCAGSTALCKATYKWTADGTSCEALKVMDCSITQAWTKNVTVACDTKLYLMTQKQSCRDNGLKLRL